MKLYNIVSGPSLNDLAMAWANGLAGATASFVVERTPEALFAVGDVVAVTKVSGHGTHGTIPTGETMVGVLQALPEKGNPVYVVDTSTGRALESSTIAKVIENELEHKLILQTASGSVYELVREKIFTFPVRVRPYNLSLSLGDQARASALGSVDGAIVQIEYFPHAQMGTLRTE